MTATIPIVPGENLWRFIRTDRDGASRDEILNMVGPIMGYCLSEVMTGGPQEKVFKTADHEWRMASARPIQAIDVSQDFLALPDGTTLGDRKHVDPNIIPTVRGSKPWYVTLRFWWRANATTVSYPAQSVNALGIATHGDLGTNSDWLLDAAVVPSSPDPDPGDVTWGQVAETKIIKVAGQVASFAENTALMLVGVAALVGLAYLVITHELDKGSPGRPAASRGFVAKGPAVGSGSAAKARK